MAQLLMEIFRFIRLCFMIIPRNKACFPLANFAFSAYFKRIPVQIYTEICLTVD